MRGVLISFDAAQRWMLHPRVALRPEPFGALAYHYDNRRLNFLRSHLLVALVRTLGEHESVDAALEASDIDPTKWPNHRTALEQLARSAFLIPADDPDRPAAAGREAAAPPGVLR